MPVPLIKGYRKFRRTDGQIGNHGPGAEIQENAVFHRNGCRSVLIDKQDGMSAPIQIEPVGSAVRVARSRLRIDGFSRQSRAVLDDKILGQIVLDILLHVLQIFQRSYLLCGAARCFRLLCSRCREHNRHREDDAEKQAYRDDFFHGFHIPSPLFSQYSGVQPASR